MTSTEEKQVEAKKAEGTDTALEESENQSGTEYPQGLRFWLILTSIYPSVFVVALDQTIIANAIPKITDEFDSLDDVAWYGSAFLITGSAVILLYGKFYTLFTPKWVFLASIGIFEIGSTICGAATSSTAFIVGRAIAGLGSSGIFTGAILILVHTVPIERRPIFQGILGTVFGISAVAGPLLGGAFTDKVSWRWCFYINLPLGGVTMLVLAFVLKPPPISNSMSTAGKPLTIYQIFLRLDPLGTLLFLPGSICLILALTWGGTTYPWSNYRVILLLVFSIVPLLSFSILQAIQPEERVSVPPRILLQRSVFSCLLYAFCVGASKMTMTYYIPIWFQTIKHQSAISSGLRLLPMLMSSVVGALIAGITTMKIGYYVPNMLASPILTSIGAGLITTWTIHTPSAKWIGYQVIYGFGLGIGMQQPNMAVQTVLNKRDVSIGTSINFFGQILGGAVCLAVAQNIFQHLLKSGLATLDTPGLTDAQRASLADTLTNTGATEIWDVVPENLLEPVLRVFNKALTSGMYVAAGASSLAMIGALTVEWFSVKKGEGQGEKGENENAAKVDGTENGTLNR